MKKSEINEFINLCFPENKQRKGLLFDDSISTYCSFATIDTETVNIEILNYQKFIQSVFNYVQKNAFTLINELEFYTDSVNPTFFNKNFLYNELFDKSKKFIEISDIDESKTTYTFATAIGFYDSNLGYFSIHIEKYKSKIDFISKSLLMILVMVHFLTLLSENHKKYVVYAHNGGKFDFILILNSLSILQYCESKNVRKITTVFRNGCYLCLNINKLSFRDSYVIVSLSLKKIAKIFINKQKIDFMNDVYSCKEFYKSFTNQTFKQEFLIYLKNDCIYLFDSLKKINDIFYSEFQLRITDGITLSSFAKKIFFIKFNKIAEVRFTKNSLINLAIKKNYLLFIEKFESLPDNYEIFYPVFLKKNIKNHLFSNPPEIERKIRSAYYGGRCEIFKPANLNDSNITCYDINSLYLSTTIHNDLPFGRPLLLNFNNPVYLNFEKSNLTTSFFKVIVFVEKPPVLLTFRFNDINYYPCGIFEGYYYYSELLEAQKNGVKILVTEIINYQKNNKAFAEYTKFMYNKRQLLLKKNNVLKQKLKTKSNQTEFVQQILQKNDCTQLIYKFLLNALYGSLGINPSPDYYFLTNSEYIKNVVDKKIQHKIIFKRHNLIFFSVSNEENKNSKLNAYNKSLATKLYILKTATHISAAITANARVRMYEAYIKPLWKNDKLFYTDTDSIFISEDLKNPIYNTSSNIGELKLEHNFVIFRVISKKVYFGISFNKDTENYELILKFKSLSSQLLEKYFDFNVYESKTISVWQKLIDYFDEVIFQNVSKTLTVTRKDVIIRNQYTSAFLSYDRQYSFNPLINEISSEKIFNKNGIWIRSEPCFFIYTDNFKINRVLNRKQFYENNIVIKQFNQLFFYEKKKSNYDNDNSTIILNNMVAKKAKLELNKEVNKNIDFIKNQKNLYKNLKEFYT